MSTFKIIKDKTDNNTQESVGFTEMAKYINPENNKSYAKITTFVSGKSQYFIKSHNGRFFNPYGLYDAGKEYKMMGGNQEWVYRKVNDSVFKLYISFLKTKNTVWLSNAERENL